MIKSTLTETPAAVRLVQAALTAAQNAHEPLARRAYLRDIALAVFATERQGLACDGVEPLLEGTDRAAFAVWQDAQACRLRRPRRTPNADTLRVIAKRQRAFIGTLEGDVVSTKYRLEAQLDQFEEANGLRTPLRPAKDPHIWHAKRPKRGL